MSQFPPDIVISILRQFGIDENVELEQWPYPDKSDDLVAGFEHEGKRYYLKRRHIEQRGERSLFETHYVLDELIKRGVPAPSLRPAPNGETMLPGPGWENKDRTFYYEIQERISGVNLELSTANAREVGAFVAQFHEAGNEIDTFLLNKQYWTNDFIQKRFRTHEDLAQQLLGASHIDAADRASLLDRLNRHHNISWRKGLTWTLIHGDLCGNNLLDDNGTYRLIDFEEIGRGEALGDWHHLLVPFEESIVTEFLAGYRSAGGRLSDTDLLAAQDSYLFGSLIQALKEDPTFSDVTRLTTRLDFILDL